MRREICILLHDIRSVYNVGAIFRTADAVGISKIFLSGYSPTPLDRFGFPRNDFAKSALGSEFTVPWETVASPEDLVVRMKGQGFTIVSVEQNAASIDYKHFAPAEKTLAIFGNEVSGVSASMLALSDVIAEIPMRGEKESLNISVSAGIVLYRWFD